MKCCDCNCCHKVEYTRWDQHKLKWVKITVYQCCGVKEPFELMDLDCECPAYPEKRETECVFCSHGVGTLSMFVHQCLEKIDRDRSLDKLYCPVCGKQLISKNHYR